MQQMGERKQLLPDLFIAQKTMAFMLCLYNPCFPASARDPDKDSKTNKMSVGGPLTPRANCTRVRDSMMSVLSPAFLQGACGTPTGREEEQNHRGSSGNHPNAWAVGICSYPWCPARPGCSSATYRNLSTVHGAALTSPNDIPPLPINAGTMLEEPGFSSLPDISHMVCQEEAEVCRPGPDKTRSVLVHLCPPSLPPSPLESRASLHRHHTHTHREKEWGVLKQQETKVAGSFRRSGGKQPAGLLERW